jgi:hypothetical protein
MKRLISIVFFLVSMGFSPLLGQSVNIGKKSFPTIQAAVNKAKPGSVIEIRGVHKESLKLNKKGITLRGENPLTDVIEGVSGSVILADGEYGAQDLTIENLTIKGGNSIQNPGGGISMKRIAGTVKLTNLIVTRNKSEKAAGGVFIAATNAIMDRCWIHENYAKQFGGAMVLQSGNESSSEIKVNNSVLSSNTSENHGGGLYVNGNPKWGDQTYLNVSMENSIITYNSSAKRGGAIFVKGALHQKDSVTNTSFKLNHVTIAYNRSTAEKGNLPGMSFYGVKGEEPAFSVMNSLIVANGGANEPDVHFAKCEVREHENNIYGKVMGLKVTAVDMTSSQVINNPMRWGLSADLTKAAGAMPELRLNANSVAIDKANPETALDTDINGKARTQADVGAVEFQ